MTPYQVAHQVINMPSRSIVAGVSGRRLQELPRHLELFARRPAGPLLNSQQHAFHHISCHCIFRPYLVFRPPGLESHGVKPWAHHTTSSTQSRNDTSSDGLCGSICSAEGPRRRRHDEHGPRTIGADTQGVYHNKSTTSLSYNFMCISTTYLPTHLCTITCS